MKNINMKYNDLLHKIEIQIILEYSLNKKNNKNIRLYYGFIIQNNYNLNYTKNLYNIKLSS